MSLPKNAVYDYLVIGAGSAGAAAACRLSEDSKVSVLLIEAGGETHPLSRMPMSFGLFINRSDVNWCYWSQPEKGTDDRRISIPRGKMLGGSSAINGMVYVRGQRQDYEDWKNLGNKGWGWSEVSKIFSRMENYSTDSGELIDDCRGRVGPLRVTKVSDKNPLYEGIFKGALSIGYPSNPDYNGIKQEGVARTQATIWRGQRMSSSYCYISPARKRPNFDLLTNALVEKLVLKGKKCVGLIYSQGGVQKQIQCGKEVILSAGAIGSPQILELSGIGSPEILQNNGITVKHALPAVGENFQDHMMTRLQWKLKNKHASYNHRMNGVNLPFTALEYLLKRTGPLSLPAAPLIAFLKTPLATERPDFQIQFIPFSIQNPVDRKFHDFPGMAVAGLPSRPISRGSVHVKSTNIKDSPDICFNFLKENIDRKIFIEGFKMIRNIINSAPMDNYRDIELSPGNEVKTDDEIENFLRNKAETGYHPMGTCRMGALADSVVDSELRVHGIDSLRVADASIFPAMLSGNLNGPSIMIGERVADFIKKI